MSLLRKKFVGVSFLFEKLHLKFCKRVLGVHSKASNVAVYAELGRVPLTVQVSSLIVKYWLRITNPLYKETLVGEAANLCIKLNSKEIVFTNNVLELSGLKTISEVHPSIDELKTVTKYVKEKLVNFCVKKV